MILHHSDIIRYHRKMLNEHEWLWCSNKTYYIQHYQILCSFLYIMIIVPFASEMMSMKVEQIELLSRPRWMQCTCIKNVIKLYIFVSCGFLLVKFQANFSIPPDCFYFHNANFPSLFPAHNLKCTQTYSPRQKLEC